MSDQIRATQAISEIERAQALYELREAWPEFFMYDDRPPDPELPKLTVKVKGGIMGELFFNRPRRTVNLSKCFCTNFFSRDFKQI